MKHGNNGAVHQGHLHYSRDWKHGSILIIPSETQLIHYWQHNNAQPSGLQMGGYLRNSYTCSRVQNEV